MTVVGNYVDSIVDLPSDRQAGEISVSKPVRMYFHLTARAVGGAVTLAAQHPNKRSFLHMTSRFFKYMRTLKEKETSTEFSHLPGLPTSRKTKATDSYNAQL